MKKEMKYETPEIEVTRFEVNIKIMDGFHGGDGDVTTWDFGEIESQPDGGNEGNAPLD